MPTTDNLTVIIPTLSNDVGLYYLLKKLGNYHLIVIDNLPSNEKMNACSAHSNCRYMPQQKNQGFARAINLAFGFVQTDWICILNDDIEFIGAPPLSRLISVARKNQWSAISPILAKKNKEIENLGYQVLPTGKTKLIYPKDVGSSPNQTVLDGLTAASLLIESATFRAVGGFDNRFFAYLEDVDLFLRLKTKGFHFGVDTSSTVIHNHMTTSSKMNNFKARMDLRNWCYLILNNWGISLLIRHFLGIIIERLRNLSGYLKVTFQTYGFRALYIAPYELTLICFYIISFPFLPRSSIKH